MSTDDSDKDGSAEETRTDNVRDPKQSPASLPEGSGLPRPDEEPQNLSSFRFADWTSKSDDLQEQLVEFVDQLEPRLRAAFVQLIHGLSREWSLWGSSMTSEAISKVMRESKVKPKSCEHCGKTFFGKVPQARHCCDSCRSMAHKARDFE